MNYQYDTSSKKRCEPSFFFLIVNNYVLLLFAWHFNKTGFLTHAFYINLLSVF